MDSSGGGFRVLEKSNLYFSADPKMVIYTLDPATLGYRKVRGNPEQLLGFPASDWCRPNFWSGRVHPDDRQAAIDFFRYSAGARRDHELEYRMIDAAGRTVWVHDMVESGDRRGQGAGQGDRRGDGPRHGQGGDLGGVLMDITPRVALETDVKKALKLKDELFRVVAEELAYPVRSISTYGEMLERHLSSQHDDVGSDYAVGLRAGVQRLDELLLQLMRIAQGGDMSFEEMTARLAAIRSAGLRS
jgi:signal transduction histidine kinase